MIHLALLTDPHVTLLIFGACIALVALALVVILALAVALIASVAGIRTRAARPPAVVVELDTSRARRAQVRRRRDSHRQGLR